MLTSGANEEDPLLGQPITQLQIDYLALKARIAEAQARIAEVEGTLSVDKINALIRLREAVP